VAAGRQHEGGTGSRWISTRQWAARCTALLGNLIARRIGIISASCIVVIAWSYHCCTEGSGTNAHAHATTDIGSSIDAATMDATDASTASIRLGIGRHTRDAHDGSRRNGKYTSV
jgi:hypothetical protein